MTSPKQKAFFASLAGSKFLCKTCLSVQPFKKYLKGGMVELACGHERHTNQIDPEVWKQNQVMNKLDDKFITTSCQRSQHFSCCSYKCICPCHDKRV